jgi:hypothetical protein
MLNQLIPLDTNLVSPGDILDIHNQVMYVSEIRRCSSTKPALACSIIIIEGSRVTAMVTVILTSKVREYER